MMNLFFFYNLYKNQTKAFVLDCNRNQPGASPQSGSKTRSEQVKLLVKQKSLGRTLSTSVLRIKKKRSFWSNEKFKQ